LRFDLSAATVFRGRPGLAFALAVLFAFVVELFGLPGLRVFFAEAVLVLLLLDFATILINLRKHPIYKFEK